LLGWGVLLRIKVVDGKVRREIVLVAASVTLYPLGVGDFGATKLFHISFLLRVDERSFVIDCPRRLFEMLAFNEQFGECAVTLADYQNILLTHLHIDHAGGIVEMAAADMIAGDKLVSLYAPPQTLAYLWSEQRERGVVSAAQLEGGVATLERYFCPIALTNPHDFGSFTLHYRATQHIPNTVAYLLDFGGISLAIAPTLHMIWNSSRGLISAT
jgi:ribonuclease BN (tRNA processing enzyme)